MCSVKGEWGSRQGKQSQESSSWHRFRHRFRLLFGGCQAQRFNVLAVNRWPWRQDSKATESVCRGRDLPRLQPVRARSGSVLGAGRGNRVHRDPALGGCGGCHRNDTRRELISISIKGFSYLSQVVTRNRNRKSARRNFLNFLVMCSVKGEWGAGKVNKVKSSPGTGSGTDFGCFLEGARPNDLTFLQ